MAEGAFTISGRRANSSVVLSMLSKEVMLNIFPSTTVQEVVVGSIQVNSRDCLLERLTRNAFLLETNAENVSHVTVIVLSGYRAYAVQDVKITRKRRSSKPVRIVSIDAIPIEIRRFFKFSDEPNRGEIVPEDQGDSSDMEEMFQSRGLQRNIVGSLTVSPIRLQLGQIA